jgi:hypothetical protein
MAFPAAWPPRPSSGLRSIRFYATGTATANFSDNAFLFIDGAGANTFTPSPAVSTSSGATVNPLTPTGTGLSPNVANQLTSPVPPMIWSQTIRLCNDGANALEYSFDGTNVHGKLLTGELALYRNRFEAGIAVRFVGGATTFRIEAW